MQTNNVTTLKTKTKTPLTRRTTTTNHSFTHVVRTTIQVTIAPYLKNPADAATVVHKLEEAFTALTVQKASTFLASQIKGFFGKN
jgi:hypothetical protein